MKKDIALGINSLTYDPDKVLVFNGASVENVNLTQDMVENDQYIAITRKTVNADNKDFEIEVVNASNSIAYAGALLLANEGLVNGTPQGLFYAQREPITLRIDLPGMGSECSQRVELVNNSNVKNAVNTLTERCLESHSDYKQAANYSYCESKAYSEDQLRVTAGFDLASKLNLDFNAVSAAKKQIFIMSFKQIFYTIALDVPERAEDFFTDNETWDNIVTQNGVDNNNPPVFVSSVVYGRTIYVTLETK